MSVRSVVLLCYLSKMCFYAVKVFDYREYIVI